MKLDRNLTKPQEPMGRLHPSSILPNVSTVRHVLAPTDLSGESRKMIKYTMHLARRVQAKLTLLHVCQLPKAAGSGANSSDEKLLEQERNQAKLKLLSLHDIVRAQYANTEPCLRFGAPPREVILAARSLAVDLIIVSRHDCAWLDENPDKSDGGSVFHDMPCPVLILREHENEYVASIMLPASMPQRLANLVFRTRRQETQ